MNDWKTIAALARRSLIVLGAALAISLSLYVGSHFVQNRMQIELTQAQQLESASQASLSEKQTDLANLQDKISRFNVLRQQGLVGVPDRESWVEQLVTSRQRIGLPDTLIYTLQIAKPLAMQNGTATGTSEPGSPQFHDLNMTLTGIHEEELLAFLSHYQTQVKGRLRVNACMLSTRTETGLSVNCTLRFFILPDANPNPSPQ